LVALSLTSSPPHQRAPLHAGRQAKVISLLLLAQRSLLALKQLALEEPRKQLVGV